MIRETRTSQMSISSRRISVTSRSNGPSKTSRSSSRATGDAATAPASARIAGRLPQPLRACRDAQHSVIAARASVVGLIDERRDVEVAGRRTAAAGRTAGRAPPSARPSAPRCGSRGCAAAPARADVVAEPGGDHRDRDLALELLVDHGAEDDVGVVVGRLAMTPAASLTSYSVRSSPPVMLSRMPRAPSMLVSSSGEWMAMSAAACGAVLAAGRRRCP